MNAMKAKVNVEMPISADNNVPDLSLKSSKMPVFVPKPNVESDIKTYARIIINTMKNSKNEFTKKLNFIFPHFSLIIYYSHSKIGPSVFLKNGISSIKLIKNC